MYRDEGVALIRSQNVLDNGMRTHDIARISQDAADALSGVTVEAGDVLMNITGDSVARVALVDPSVLPARVNQHVAIIRPAHEVNSLFLQKILVSPEVKSRLLVMATGGATRNALTKSQLIKFVIPLPPRREQQAIAEVLGALDDKISANIALAETQLNIADYMFPVTQDAASARLGDYVTVTKGNSYRSADLGPSPTALVTLKSITRDGRYAYTGLREFTGPYKPQQVISGGDIVVAQTDLTQAADVVGRAVRVPSSQKHKLVASLDLAVVRPRENIDALYLLGLLRQERFRTHARAHTTGTTVLHLASGAIEEYVVSIVSSIDQQEYAAKAAALLAHSERLIVENRTLAAIRDALLPQLMSGKLRVRDAEAIAADAGA